MVAAEADVTRQRAVLLGGIAAVLGAKVWLSAQVGVLADEAYHWTWARELAWGYYDQPPFIAWCIATVGAAGQTTALQLRAVPLGCTVVVLVAMAWASRDRALAALWVLGLPPLAILTTFCVPDATLLAGWAVCLAGAVRGGTRGWSLAAAGAVIASMSKYSGLAVLPLAVLGADSHERRTPWPWLALTAWALALMPHLGWLWTHDWVTVRFQAVEGLWSPRGPRVAGLWVQLRDQVAFVTPIAWVAGVGWGALSACSVCTGTAPRLTRIAWWTGVPVVVGFWLASMGGPPEAHWPAPAWLSIGLGLTTVTGRLQRWAWTGAWLGAGLTGAAAVHAVMPLLSFGVDPVHRLEEGPLLADAVARWALPEGTTSWEPATLAAPVVVAERYQEAALIALYTGLPTRTAPGCGRISQYDLAVNGPEMADAAWFVRPARGGELRCGSLPGPAGDAELLSPRSHRGRVGPWQLYPLGSAP